MRSKISLWIDKEWHPLFNSLPNEFYDIKQDIIVRLINLGVALQKTHLSDCQKMSEQLISVHDTPENIKQTVTSNHSVYKGSKYGGIGAIIWVFIMIVRAVTSDSCNSSSNDYHLKSTEFNSHQVDSLMKTLHDNKKLKVGDTITFQ